MSPPLVLILSSHVAASPVGGSAQAAALAGVGVETMLVPTVLFGRHPGLGAPGGGPVGIEIFEGMLAGVEAAGAFARLDAAVTGYFADPAQVAAAARALDAIRAVNREAWLIVDPIMGDRGVGLYVPEAVARAVAGDLVSRADLIAPNAWELERLTGRGAADPASALAAARSLDRPVLVSSVEIGADIGVIYADAGQAWLASHPRRADAPRGSGDRLTALFAGAVLGGASPREALERSVRAVAGLATGAPVDVRLEALG